MAIKFNSKLIEIEQIILRNYTNNNFCVDKLAEISELSTSYLRELFYKHHCICPQRYIENIRLEHAIKILLGDISLYEVSSFTGFCDERAFRNAFKKRFSFTPPAMKERLYENDSNIKYFKQSLIKQLWQNDKRPVIMTVDLCR